MGGIPGKPKRNPQNIDEAFLYSTILDVDLALKCAKLDPMSEPTVGSYDNFFDAADILQKMGAEFAIVARHEGTRNIITLSNIDEPKMALRCVIALDEEFKSRFGHKDPEPDTGNAI